MKFKQGDKVRIINKNSCLKGDQWRFANRTGTIGKATQQEDYFRVIISGEKDTFFHKDFLELIKNDSYDQESL